MCDIGCYQNIVNNFIQIKSIADMLRSVDIIAKAKAYDK